jgi:hypothetical protein
VCFILLKFGPLGFFTGIETQGHAAGESMIETSAKQYTMIRHGRFQI